MGKKGLIKLLAASALVGAAVHLYKKNDGDKKKAELMKLADKVGKKVSTQAKKMGKMTKASFKSIVNEVSSEFSETADITKAELKDLKAELMDSWDEIQAEFTTKKPAKKKTAKKKK